MTISKSRGFTTIELLVSVFVMLVTITIAVPSLTQAIAHNKAATQINGVFSLLNYARSEAIKQGRRVSVCPRNAAGTACSDVWKNGLLVFVDTNANGTLGPGEDVLRVGDAITGGNTFFVRLAGTTTVTNTIVYTSLGNASVSVDLKLCSTSTHTLTTLTVSNVGRITTTKGTCSSS